ncbi:MAG: hypothetical protein ACTHME_05165 [Candidatus Nitrosocosmicus sp.]
MYSKQTRCPDCRSPLSDSTKYCECGWSPSSQVEAYDPRCKFILSGKRCPLPGSISQSVGKSDDLMCTYHQKYRGDFSSSSRWLGFIEKKFEEIMHFRKHYSSNFQNCDRCEKFSKNEEVFRIEKKSRQESHENTNFEKIQNRNLRHVGDVFESYPVG